MRSRDFGRTISGATQPVSTAEEGSRQAPDPLRFLGGSVVIALKMSADAHPDIRGADSPVRRSSRSRLKWLSRSAKVCFHSCVRGASLPGTPPREQFG